MQPVAISNRRLVAADDGSGSWPLENHGDRAHELIRWFLMHALPKGFGGDLPTLVFRSQLCDGPYVPT